MKTRRGLYYNEERPCGRGEELTLFVEKNALRLLRRLRWGAKRRTRVARRGVSVQISHPLCHTAVAAFKGRRQRAVNTGQQVTVVVVHQ